MIKIIASARRLDELARRFQAMHARAKNVQPRVARTLARRLKGIAENRVRVTKLDPAGRRWRPWSDSYARTRGPQHSLLVANGDLLRGFRAYASPSGRMVTLSNVEPHARWANIRRRFLGFGKLEEQAGEDIASGQLRDLLR